jgi:hypothetical protein
MNDRRRRIAFAEIITALSNGKIRAVMDGSAGSPDIAPYILDLVRANGGWKEPDIEAASNFLGAARLEAQRIGQMIHDRHGFDGMQAVCGWISAILPAGASRELECAWHGIGEWRA